MSTTSQPPISDLGDERVVLVVGAGLMGSEIAAEYALGGFHVRIVNRSHESGLRAVGRARSTLGQMVELGLADGNQAAAAEGRLTACDSVLEACRDAEIVLESVVEDMHAKVQALAAAVEAAPQATICTNTSALSVGELGDRLGCGRRILATHYWNPPSLMPLVELAPGPDTEVERLETMESLLRGLGKEPVRVPDIPGFIWNRLQAALLKEALGLVLSGQVDSATIDLVVRRGLARRWSVVGPFQSVHLGGPATFVRVAQVLWDQLYRDVRLEQAAGIAIPEADPGLRAARDQALAELLRADRATARSS